MEKSKKKNVTYKKVTKGLIVGFLSYGLLVGFIYCVFIAILYSYYQTNLVYQNNQIILTTCVSLLIAIGIILLNYAICKLSTIDVLKKVKLSNNVIKKTSSSMGTFFICLMIVTVLFLNYFLLMTIMNERNALIASKNELNSSEFSTSTAISIFDKELAKFELTKKCLIIRTLIIEFSFIVSFISLMPYQKKVLKKYNGSFDTYIYNADTDTV